MRILVTGGAGFIGSHLVDALVAKHHAVTIVDDLSCGKQENICEGANLIREDIRSPRLKDIFRDVRPEIVFHLAAQKNIRQSVADPVGDAAVNISGSLNVLHLAHRFGVKKIIVSSTGGALYGDRVKRPTPETVPPAPTTPYGIAKHTIDQYLAFYGLQYGLRGVSLRYANVYGPRQDPAGEAGVVAIFADQLQQGKPLTINGHGRQTRDYVYVADVVEANLAAMKRAATGPIHIGTGKQTSVNRLAELLLKVSGQRGKIVHRQAVPHELQRSALQAARARKLLQWRAKTDLVSGLTLTMNWWKEQ